VHDAFVQPQSKDDRIERPLPPSAGAADLGLHPRSKAERLSVHEIAWPSRNTGLAPRWASVDVSRWVIGHALALQALQILHGWLLVLFQPACNGLRGRPCKIWPAVRAVLTGRRQP
jgi:hypothetical protein